MSIDERQGPASPRIGIPLAVLFVALFYYTGARIGNVLSFPPDFISVLWPPNAILLVALLRTAPRQWPYFLAAVIPAQLASDLPAGIPIPMTIGFILSNWIEVLIPASLLRRFLREDLHFQSLRNVATYIVCAVLIGPLISAFPGAFSNFSFGPGGIGFWPQFSRWFLSDGLTHLTLTTTIYMWLSVPPLRKMRLTPARWMELLILMVCLSITGFLALGIRAEAISSIPALLYIPLPFLLWVSVRFGPRSIFTAALFITIITIVTTWYGYGPFTSLSTPHSVLNLQFFLIASLAPLIVLSVVIEEQKIIRRKMRESEERIRQITDFLPETIFEIDRRGRITYVNRVGLSQFGYAAADQEEGIFGLEMITPADRKRGSENIERVLRGEELGLNEYRARRKDGTEFPTLMRSSPILRDGRINGLRGFVVDITERKKMEEDLRESEAKYRQIVQHAPAGIYEIDLERNRFINFNNVWRQYTGYSRQELMKMVPADLLTPESRRTMAWVKGEAASGNPRPAPVEYEIRTRDNRNVWIMVNYRFHFEGGVPKRSTAVVHDITEKRQMEAERKALEDRLHQVQKMESIGTLAGGIAHDFNNLLTGILGNASLVRLHYDRNHPNHERLTAIENFVQRASNLTGQLLGLARGGKFEVKPTDINNLVLNESELFARTRKEIEIHRELAEDIGTVEVDQGQIEQVLLNLFVNAWQAMPDGGEITIRTENVVLDDCFVGPYGIRPGPFVRVSVADTGIGMDAETQRRIFDPFFTTRKKERGTGLGLASAYGIIKNHGGIIDVTSSPGQGARFDIYLPVSGGPLPKERKIVEFPTRGKGTILLIDDEKMIRDVGREMLAHLGYQTLLAPDGITGVDIYEKERDRIQLVILDMIMPKTSGRQTFDRLKAVDPHVRVILSSGYSEEGQAAEILSRGCEGFIQKPFTLEQLSEKIGKVLGPL